MIGTCSRSYFDRGVSMYRNSSQPIVAEFLRPYILSNESRAGLSSPSPVEYKRKEIPGLAEGKVRSLSVNKKSPLVSPILGVAFEGEGDGLCMAIPRISSDSVKTRTCSHSVQLKRIAADHDKL